MVLERPNTKGGGGVPPSWLHGGVGSFGSVVALEVSWTSVELIVARSMALAKLSLGGMGASTLNVGLGGPPSTEVESPPPGGGVETAKSLVLPKGPRALAGNVAITLGGDWEGGAGLSFPPGSVEDRFLSTVLFGGKIVSGRLI